MSIEHCKLILNDARCILKYIRNLELESDYECCLIDIYEMIDLLTELINKEFDFLKSKDCEKSKNDKNPLNVFVDRLVCEVSDIVNSITIKDLKDFKDTCTTEKKLRGNSCIVLQSLAKQLRDKKIKINNMLSAFNALKHLDGHHKTLVIIGPNGCGKTSFANLLRAVDDHVKVIPALKPLRAIKRFGDVDSSLESVNSDLYGRIVLEDTALQKLIAAICKEHDNVAREYRDNPELNQESSYEKIKKVFDGFFSVKLDHSKFSDREMMAHKEQESPFAFNDMSDGERAAFFYIATVLTAPKYSFIVVDEPENHLNPAIYNKLWNELISLREDCQFIFISHAVDFIKARINCELVRVDRYVNPNRFEFKFLGSSYVELPVDNVVEIVGSRKPILFCEGTKGGDDYAIYEIFFGKQFTIIPAGSCEDVKHSVISCNKYANLFDFEYAIGIIDSDLRDEVNIEKLKEHRIYSLPCNEIEMMLLDEDIFRKALERLYEGEDKFLEFQKDFFEKIHSKKEIIIKRFAKNRVENKLRFQIINDKMVKSKSDFCLEVKGIFENIDAESIWSECEDLIEDVLNKKDYQAALKYCCLQHNEVLNGIANQYVHDYRKLALSVLGNDAEFAEGIKKKYFPSIDNSRSSED